MRRALALIWTVAALSVACQQSEPPPPGIPYEDTPGSVVVRITTESPAQAVEFQRNAMPTCTLYGDGRVVWANPLEGGGEQLLEGYASPEAMQEYFHFITDAGLFAWADQVSADVLPPEGVDAYTTISVTLAGEMRAVSAYDSGALHGFDDIINRCLELVTEPILIEPGAGWLTAFAAQAQGDRPSVCWPQDAPVRLADVAEAGQVWLEGQYATFVWSNIHESEGIPLFMEGGACTPGESGFGQLYTVIFEVPGISPYSPSPPGV